MENNHNPMEDDGSLDFLKIPADETNKHFNCPETTQQKLINLTFWVCDYIEGVKTKFGENRTLMRKSIKQNFCRMAARLNKKLNISARDYKQKLCSWYGWAKVSNSKHLLKIIIKSQFYDTFVLRCKAV